MKIIEIPDDYVPHWKMFASLLQNNLTILFQKKTGIGAL
jgi:hypothetical protein